ncbi:MAG: C-GCAxxG-C-C family protein [Prevotellaceae bacterium]|nr:C-GCAxxG-C-C family protein [Prevotellaceae bacterium]
MLQRKKSEEFFHQMPENWNCAQSILKGFQAELNIPESRVAEFKAYGGGRVPEGICGALYAANILLSEQGKKSVNGEFAIKVGAIHCLNIKKEARTSCKDCVKIADKLVEEKLKKI